MKNDLGLKLIVVADVKRLIFYSAKGLKITDALAGIEVPVDKHHRKEKSGSHIQKSNGQNSLYEPHTSPEKIEHHEAAEFICHEIERHVHENPDFKEVIIVADPKSLGFIRNQLNHNIKKMVTKEIAKDLTHHTKAEVEEIIFA